VTARGTTRRVFDYEHGTEDASAGFFPRSRGVEYRRGYEQGVFREVRRLRNILRTCPGCWLFDPAAPETGCSYQVGVGEAAGPGCVSRREKGRGRDNA
jgi:hypothetical protein